MVSLLHGMLADRPSSWDELDDKDEFRDWIVRHGVPQSLSWSPPIQELYCAAFGFEDGDRDKPNMGAGVNAQVLFLSTMRCSGHIGYHMNGGTGDVLITPLYQVLKKRGVKFEFWHRVEDIRLGRTADNGASLTQEVDEVEMSVQVKLKNPQAEYQPFVTVKGVEAWPSNPLYDQLDLEDVEEFKKYDLESLYTPWVPAGKKVLKRGKDFDKVVLAIPVGGLHHMTKDLAKASVSWKNMLDHVKTVPTYGK